MSIKLVLLKSGEDIITDITEMRTEEGADGRVVGYFMDKPCVVKMRNPQTQAPDGNTQKAGFEVDEEWEMDDNSIELTVTRWV